LLNWMWLYDIRLHFRHSVSVFIVFLPIRLPSSSTLFPYTTLFRSFLQGRYAEAQASLTTSVALRPEYLNAEVEPCHPTLLFLYRDRKSTRLNSRSRENLVCRLLLEKKKNK